jgi:hypothetical protein
VAAIPGRAALGRGGALHAVRRLPGRVFPTDDGVLRAMFAVLSWPLALVVPVHSSEQGTAEPVGAVAFAALMAAAAVACVVLRRRLHRAVLPVVLLLDVGFTVYGLAEREAHWVRLLERRHQGRHLAGTALGEGAVDRLESLDSRDDVRGGPGVGPHAWDRRPPPAPVGVRSLVTCDDHFRPGETTGRPTADAAAPCRRS